MARIRDYFELAQDRKASDIYFFVGSQPALRIAGDLHALEEHPAMGKDDLAALAREVLSPEQFEQFAARKDFTCTQSIEDLGRVRVVASEGRNGYSLACRLIPPQAPSLAALGLPSELIRIVSASQGLVLVIGSSSSGKTTTLASLIDCINNRFPKAVLTLEQPVEFVHKSNLSLIEQVNYDGGVRLEDLLHPEFLKSVDVLVLDGLDNKDTVSLGVNAAANGVLVLASLESSGGVAETLKLMIELFPSPQQESVRGLLASTLRAVVWQHLFPLQDCSGCKPAVEILINDKAIAGLISRPGALHLIRPTIAAGRVKGMQTMHQALQALKEEAVVKEDRIESFENMILAYYVYPVTEKF